MSMPHADRSHSPDLERFLYNREVVIDRGGRLELPIFARWRY